MFDVAFSELIVIGVVALVVIGPERLPRVARMAGALLGRVQRYASDVKAEVNRQIELDEINRLQQDVKDSVHTLETQVSHELQQVEQAVEPTIAPLRVPTPAPDAEHKP
jgi:sec-independent protein translocase protein TatB